VSEPVATGGVHVKGGLGVQVGDKTTQMNLFVSGHVGGKGPVQWCWSAGHPC
jgi:hypothetical protein